MLRYPRLFRYLFSQHLRMGLSVTLGIFLLVVLGQFADMSSYLSELPGWSPLQSLRIALFRTPTLMQAILPHVVLISAALALARLGRRLEIAVMMQNGLSPARILFPVMLVSLCAGVIFSAVVSPWAARAFAEAEKTLQSVAGRAGGAHRSPRQMVLRAPEGGSLYVLIDHVPPEPEILHGLAIYRVDADNRLLETLEAARARRIGADLWRLEESRRLHLAPGEQARIAPEGILRLDPAALAEVAADPQALSLYELPQAIRVAEATGAPSAALRLRLAWLLALPVMLAAVSWLGGAIVLRPLYRNAWKGDTGAVLAAAFVIYTVTTLFDALGARAVVPVWVSVVVLPVMALAGGWLILLRRHGGLGRSLARRLR
ncbi:Lipopolysaccharide export LptBFGC system, permease protein LptF [Meinhardsimonia xiamenensis]|jgi:lipopolysaccharide export system permease protein|uniref:Lipopolysaccharide export LptBFGC system, permease protein LptF n=1 Tax=Meinhardsimonia xiamenensis TaxID=990712 RepID=A0A1G9FGS7_9RHOB|nr:LptF/LptG family permease [Meinhardsimonia xiamenensis]PRX37853.1 lipopolysaccharide export LptBFGC system permease protein LptF [Meinhardsimonia xiamenensis]SDK87579.1 Lipopolysaccharide export LptBFGC system, permease protein LptF [Meinhardsimonia xiamenensis]